MQSVIGTSNNTIFRGGTLENCTKVHTISEQVNQGEFGWVEVFVTGMEGRKLKSLEGCRRHFVCNERVSSGTIL